MLLSIKSVQPTAHGTHPDITSFILMDAVNNIAGKIIVYLIKLCKLTGRRMINADATVVCTYPDVATLVLIKASYYIACYIVRVIAFFSVAMKMGNALR